MSSTPIHPNHAANRTRAVMLMLAELPAVHTLAEAAVQADVLQRFTVEQRATWARHCGVQSVPSDETWTLLVRMAGLRKPVSEAFVRAARTVRTV